MGRIILTGLTKNKNHEFKLDYVVINDREVCVVECKCGWKGEIKYFQNYAGTKELAKLWETHSRLKPKKSG